MKFFDDKSKKVKWYNRNYLYAGTILYVILNIVLFASLGSNFVSFIGGQHVGNGVFDVSNLLRSYLSSFAHLNWQHVLLNMLSFLSCGLYIERKIGTLNFLLLILGFSFFAGNITTAARNSVNHCGASGVIYMCYAYIIIDYIISLFREKGYNKTNIILGAIIIVLIYVSMCYCDLNGFGFKWYPYSFIFNAAHYSSFFAGIIISLMIQIPQLKYRKNIHLPKEERKSKPEQPK
ncbi:MAG: rhomboid family intramembrane serine protease [Clostridia bacterium]|nr:rhomboid family intramembrane serine protease [Clostridia bacterium]